MEISGGIVAFAIIAAIAYWVNSNREDKERVVANEKAAKIAQTERNNLMQARKEARKAIRSRARDFGVEYTEDELDWICDVFEANSGKSGLIKIRNIFETYPQDKLEAFMMRIEVEHSKYLIEQQATERSNESEQKWQEILEDFKRLNSAQQKSHLAYIKKNHADELTDEQLHILELISLNEQKQPSNTDVMVGDVKLFSMRKK